MTKLALELNALFPTSNVVLTSRGITALYLALDAIRETHGPGEVIVPATVCPSVALAVIYAGHTPRFCDVELNTFCLSEQTVAACLSPKTKAVIVVYLFGKSVNIRGIADLAHRHGIFVIEDLAQAVGGKHDSEFLGNFGDFGILSFNDVKILPGSAGVLLVRDTDLLPRITKSQTRLRNSLTSQRRQALSLSFRNLTHGLYDLLRSKDIKEAIKIFPDTGEYYRELFVYDNNKSNNPLKKEIQGLKLLYDNIEKRKINYEIYEKYLRKDLNYVRFNSEEVCWRLPILLDNYDQQIQLLQSVREKNILISNHYFPSSYLFGISDLTNARQIGLRAINLWVDEKIDREKIITVCNDINKMI